MNNKSKIVIIISIIGLALVLATVTYAYFSARITGIESASTISMTAGTMSIHYSEGDGTLTASNMYPRAEEWISKDFTLTGNNTTTQLMEYEVGIEIITNTFKGGQLSYSLIVDENNDGTSMSPVTNKAIVGQNRTQKIGEGSFGTITDGVQNYTLKIYFLDNGKNQNINQGAVFNAKLTIGEKVQRNISVNIPTNNCTDEAHPTLVEGDEYVNGQYTYRYKKGKSYSGWFSVSNDGWGVILTDKTSTDPVTTKLCTSINGKPIVSMSYMFYKSQATSIDLSSFDTSKVTNMSYMFGGSAATTLDLSSFDTSQVTTMSYMFEESAAISLDLSGFDTSSVTKLERMFYKSQATSLDLSSFDTSKVTNMSYMFEESAATTLDLSSFDTSKVTTMSNMFSKSQATSIDLSSFDTAKVSTMSYMFKESKATSLDLSSFDTSNVKSMEIMFYKSQATSLDLSSFDTSNVTNMYGMFYDSKSTSINLSSFDTSNVTNMGFMFYNSVATTLDLNNFDTAKVTNMGSMFEGSVATNLDLSSFDTSSVTVTSYMFQKCKATTGYARTQADADKLNSSSNKPAGLTFVVKP